MLQTSFSSVGVFSHRDMRLVVPARALSFLGDSLALVVLSLRIAEQQEPALMMLMMAAFSVPVFALAPLAGRLVDEHDSRALLVTAGSVQVVASAGIVLSQDVAGMLGFVVLLQAGHAVTGPAWAALVPRIVGAELVGKAVGLQQSLAGLAGLGGAALGGVLYDVVGYHLTLVIDTSTFAVLVVVAALVRTRRGRRYEASRAVAGHAVGRYARGESGWQLIRSDAVLRLLVPALWLFVVSAEATNVVEVFLIRDDLGASATMYGVVMAAFMLGQIGGPLLATKVRSERGQITWTAIAAAAIGVLLVAIGMSSTVAIAIPVFVVVGVAGGALNTLIATLLILRSPEQVRGRAIATLTGTARGCSLVALVGGGIAGQLLGARTTFVICGALSALVSLIVARARRSARSPVSQPAVKAETIDA